jgi:FkbM family methyltransferase
MNAMKQVAQRRFPRIYDRLREVKLSLVLRFFQPEIVVHRYGGHEFKVTIADPMSRGWYDHDWERLGALDLLCASGLREGALVFDVGAHQNVVAMMLAREAGPAGRVVAVEGSRHNCEIGAGNAALNGFGNIVTVHAVAGETAGEAYFSDALNGHVTASENDFMSRRVRGVTVDSLAAEFGAPDVLFMDIEGFEIAALRGASKTLATSAAWFIEMHGDKTLGRYGARNADVFEFFRGDWVFYSCEDETLPFVRIDAGSALPASRFFLIVVPGAAGAGLAAEAG